MYILICPDVYSISTSNVKACIKIHINQRRVLRDLNEIFEKPSFETINMVILKKDTNQYWNAATNAISNSSNLTL